MRLCVGVCVATRIRESVFIRASVFSSLTPQCVLAQRCAYDNCPRSMLSTAGMYHYLALTQSGRVYAWGSNTNNQATVPGYLQDGSVSAVAIAAGQWHSLALLDNGTVVAWGSNSDGQVSLLCMHVKRHIHTCRCAHASV